MNSQINENASGQPDVDRMLDEADGRIAALAADRAMVAERRRALLEPAYKTVVANPTELHHKITLGAVLVNTGLAAADADALSGLLAFNADQVMADMDDLIDTDPFMSFGQVMVRMIDVYNRGLTGRGLFEIWCRRLAAYQADRGEWLARDDEFRLAGAWRDEAMTTGQRWLVRVTCRIRRIDMPGHLSRGEAADWLEARGANLNYRDFA